MINNKTKPSDYKCLSKKDGEDKRKWFSKSKPSKKPKTHKQNLDEMANKLKGKTYSEFLRSEYWKIIRKKILKRDGNKCRICGFEKNLQIHHDSYKHHFREHRHLKDLMVMCGKCHTEHHHCTD